LEDRVVKVIEEAKNDKTLEPRVNKLCPWCEYKNICPKYEV
jgi:CRISPR/Cas system-associated exonuclease Cas4 (RecB family)